MLPGLQRGQRQGLALVVSQEQRVGGASGLAALVADGRPAVLGGGMTAVELNAREVEQPPG